MPDLPVMFEGRSPIGGFPYGVQRYFVKSGVERDDDFRIGYFALFVDVGLDYDDVTETLELEGVQKFADSFAELLGEVRAKRGELVAA